MQVCSHAHHDGALVYVLSTELLAKGNILTHQYGCTGNGSGVLLRYQGSDCSVPVYNTAKKATKYSDMSPSDFRRLLFRGIKSAKLILST